MNEVRYTLRQLEYFVTVAEAGSISAAAAHSHVSAPGLSLALSELERALDVQLFMRRRAKGVTLTTAGQAVLAAARTVLAEAGQLQADARSEGGSMSGRLAVGCYTTLSPFLIPRLLSGFTERHPRTQLSFTESAQPDLERELVAGNLELALMYQHDLHPELETTVVATQPPYVLLPAGHRLAGEAAVSLRDLTAEPLVLFDVSPSRENWQRMVGALGIDPVIGFRTENFELVRCLVARGAGYGVLFQHPSIDLTYDGSTVVSRPVAEELPPATIVVASLARGRLSERARRFREFVVEELAGGPQRPGSAVPGPGGANTSRASASEL